MGSRAGRLESVGGMNLIARMPPNAAHRLRASSPTSADRS